MAGVHPLRRHDGSDFATSGLRGDRDRANKAGQPSRFRGCCVDYRGDWEWLKKVYGVQGWSRCTDGAHVRCCWRCPCTVSQLPDFSLAAPWRQGEYSTEDYLQMLLTDRQDL
eukprot:4865604-Pyramimonas_sp.AAC.1